MTKTKMGDLPMSLGDFIAAMALIPCILALMSVAAWVKSKLRPSTRHEGSAEVPFATVAHDEYKRAVGVDDAELNARILSAPIRDVPMDRLVGIQHTVKADQVAHYVEEPDAEGKNGKLVPTDLPIVVKANGTNYLHDGHHRSVAASLRGERTIRARYVDLDAEMAGRR